jgi:hypothetical protein
MKTELLKKSFVVAFIVFMVTLVLSTRTNAADSTNSKSSDISGTQTSKIPNMPNRRVNWTAVSPSNFTPDMPFVDAINILRNTTIPPLNIIVLWKNLEAVDIYRDTPIGIDGASGVPLRTHLKLLLMSLSAGSTEKLGYVVDGGAVIISTESTLPKKMKTRIYDITDLVGTPAGGAGFVPMGMPFGFGAMQFGAMLPMGLGGLFGGMMPYGGTGYTGQGQTPYGNITSR